ncbi:thiolase-like protein [Xylaria arbuscula]|nr:thiolase-like protein [Xylaria arbuscula]
MGKVFGKGGVLENCEKTPLPISAAFHVKHLDPIAWDQIIGSANDALLAPDTPSVSPDDIAIIGMGVRLPGSETLEEFWNALGDGRDLHERIPADRFDLAAYFNASGSKPNTTRTSGLFRQASVQDVAARGPRNRPLAAIAPTCDERLSYSVDTAYSRSAAPIQLAVSSLLSRECDMAVSGGVNLPTAPNVFAGLCRGDFLSDTGGCKTFDDAERLFGTLLTKLNLSPEDINYVEMHSKSTQAGDATEMSSVINVLARNCRTAANPLYVGSVKPNLGHGEAGSCVTSLIKAVMMLRKSIIPPHIGIKNRINKKLPNLAEFHTRLSMGNTSFLP